MDKLLEYQKTHVESIINSLVAYNRALDASDTGTGKTFTSVCACKIIGWKPFIICPKSVISSWLKVLEFFKCDYYGITNYELMQNCTYFNSHGEKKKIPFLTRDIVNKQKNNSSGFGSGLDSSSDSDNSNEIKYEYKWLNEQIPTNIMFIFDEAHRCKNATTNNGKIIHNLAIYKNIKILILSATVADKPKYFILAGFILGLYDNIRKGRIWIKKLSYKSNLMEGVHKKIYPEYASRMKVSDVKNYFPDCKIIAESRPMDNAVEIQAAWDEIKQATEELKKQELNSSPLPRIIYARQRIELLKVPEFIKLTQEEIAKGNSVVLFVNFTETLLTLSEKLDTKCLIYGEQKIDDRDKNIADFQNDNKRICICNIKAGGTGISLHDTIGNFPRVSIISPTWSAQDLIQVLGRIYRANAKSKVLQRIIFCKNTVEDEVCLMIKNKVSNIAFINDGSMESYKIEGLNDEILIPNNIEKNNINLINGPDGNFSKILNKITKSPEKLISNNTEKNNKNLINELDDNFSKIINNLIILYEKKNILQKELNLTNKEINELEELLNSINLINNQDNNFSKIFDKITKLYEKKNISQKELNLVNGEINKYEELLNTIY